MKTIEQVTKMQLPMSGYEVAGYLYGDSNDTALASSAYREMENVGWIFYTYDEFGEEVWAPPSD